jgi:hypothetical protein
MLAGYLARVTPFLLEARRVRHAHHVDRCAWRTLLNTSRAQHPTEDDALVVLVLAVDKREDMAAYRSAVERLLSGQ